MRPVYATRLTVTSRSHQDPDEIYEQLIRMAHRWMVQEIGPKLQHDPVWPQYMLRKAVDDFRDENTQGTCRVEVRNLCFGEERAWRGTMVHPFHEAFHERRDLQLRSEVQVRLAGRQSIVTARRMIGVMTEVMRPDRYEVATPGLIYEIIEKYKTRCGNVEIRPGAWNVGDRRVRQLVEMVQDPSRRMPVVVISRTAEGDVFVDPEVVSETLSGLAQVVILRTAGAAAYFTRMMQLTLPVTDGSVRVFWPGFSRRDHPTKHLFFPVEEMDAAGEHLPRKLRQMLTELSCLTYSSDTRVWELERALADKAAAERGKAIDDLRSRIRSDDRDDTEKPLEKILEELGTLIDTERVALQRDREATQSLLDDGIADVAAAKQDLDKDRQTLSMKLDDTKASLEDARSRLQLAQEANVALAAQLRAIPDIQSDDFTNYISLLTQVRVLADLLPVLEAAIGSEVLVFLDEARVSARKSTYDGQLLPVLQFMCRICLVAQKYHSQQISNFVQAFQEFGISNYANHTSEATYNAHRKHYERLYDDGDGKGPQKILLGPHATLGNGETRYGVKVYWYCDTTRRRFVVGHIGSHLPIVSHRS